MKELEQKVKKLYAEYKQAKSQLMAELMSERDMSRNEAELYIQRMLVIDSMDLSNF